MRPLKAEEEFLVAGAIGGVGEFDRLLLLQSLLEFERMVSKLSRTFISLPVNRIDGEINDGLKILGHALDLDRISIISTHSSTTNRTVTHSWAREGVPPTPLGETKEAFPWLVSRTAGREIFCVSSPNELPEEATAEREYMLSAGAQSWMTIPLLVGGEQIGRMGTSMFRRKQIWDPRLISNFQQAADIFAGALMRKRAAEAQSESEERFRTVANTAPVMIWMSGTDKLCTFVNQGWLSFTGRTMEEQTGQGWASGLHPEDLDRCLEIYSAAFDARSNFRMDYRLQRHDGEFRWVLASGVPRFETSGRFLGFIGSCIDITEQKQAEDALSTINQKLIQAHEDERTEIARELHDDINQQLALLAVNLECLKQRLPASARELRQHVGAAYEQATSLGSDVQALSHRLHSSKLEVLGLAAAAASFCSEHSDRQDVKIDFHCENVRKDLSQEVSICLFRVLQEAVQNATKHSGSRDLQVRLTGGVNEIELIVHDSGIGFEPEKAIKGHGLGLTSMKERIKLVAGQLSIESKPQGGTSIYARVPVGSKAKSAGALR